MPPDFRFLRLALFLADASLPSGFDNGPLAMSLKELPGVFADLDLAHPHRSISKTLRRRIRRPG
jgi:hypothetical protein